MEGIISGDGQTNEIDGEVERTGTYWVENIPILAETNELTLIATDVAGNSSSTNLTILKSHEDVGLVFESLPSGKDLYQPFGVVTGRVKPGYDVYVNGAKAVVEPNGHWRAENVPISAGGTASFDVTTVLTETNIVSKTSMKILIIFNYRQPMSDRNPLS